MEDIKSTYKIKTRTLILTEYNEFLYQLYLPLIGHKAVFLYEYLTNELRYGKTKMSLEEILERSSLNLQDFIFERQMLESVGLISTFNKDNEYIVILNPILSPKNFFNDDVLKGLLISKTSKERVLEIMEKYQIDDNDEGYKEITASINDNFVIDFEYNDLKIGKDLKLISTNKINRNDSFDDVFFFKQLGEISNFNSRSLSKKELKKIHSLAVIYNLDEKVMSEIVRNCLDPLKKVGEKLDVEALTNLAISEVVAAKSYNSIYKRKPKKIKISSESDIAKKIDYYQAISPRDLLKERQNGVEPVKSDLIIINYLNENMQFDYSVINVILDYTLEHLNNSLNRDYIEKIAATLRRNKCKTCLDALNFLYNVNKEVKSTKVTKKSDESNDNEDLNLNLEELI